MFNNADVRETGPHIIPGGHSISIEELIGGNIKFQRLTNHGSKYSQPSKYIKDAKEDHYYAWRVYDKNVRGGLKADTLRADSLYHAIRRGLVRPVTREMLKDDIDLPYDTTTLDPHLDPSGDMDCVTYRGMMLVELSEEEYIEGYLSRAALTAQQLHKLDPGKAFKNELDGAGIRGVEVKSYFGNNESSGIGL